MTRIELMKSMIKMNEALQNRRLSFFEKAVGVVIMSVQSKQELTEAEFSLRAFFVNQEEE